MKFEIAVVSGDGIGPEITKSALAVLDKVAKKSGHTFLYEDIIAGGVSIDKFGVPLTPEYLEKCKSADAVLLAAVGGVKWDTLPGHLRPERALLGIRKELGLYANLRPVKLYPELKDACPLKNDGIDGGFDIMIVRELTGGIYYGARGRKQTDGGETAFDTEEYSEAEIERIVKIACEIAENRTGNVISVDKANVLESSRLWREVAHKTAEKFSKVVMTDMLVDNAAMQLIRRPSQFDVMVTSNMFGDILSDEASQLTGSIGMLASASLGENKRGMYEPIHGSAPDIAGKDVANPIAMVLSVAMMLRHSFGLENEAVMVENAVDRVLKSGARTADIADKNVAKPLKTSEMTALILSELD